MIDAIILAGETSLTCPMVPKALLRINGRELISYQIGYLKDKVSRIIVAVGYGDCAKRIQEHIDDEHPELAIICVYEDKPLGTAGAIRNCVEHVQTERVLVLNADDLADINIKELQKEEGNIICVQTPKLPFGIIEKNSDETKRLRGEYSFIERPVLKGVWTNCGWYLFDKSKIQNFPLVGNLEYNVFPKLNFKIHKHLGHWHTFHKQKDVELYEMNNKIIKGRS